MKGVYTVDGVKVTKTVWKCGELTIAAGSDRFAIRISNNSPLEVSKTVINASLIPQVEDADGFHAIGPIRCTPTLFPNFRLDDGVEGTGSYNFVINWQDHEESVPLSYDEASSLRYFLADRSADEGDVSNAWS